MSVWLTNPFDSVAIIAEDFKYTRSVEALIKKTEKVGSGVSNFDRRVA